MDDRRWLRSVARGIVFLMQLGVSMLLPPVLCLAGAWYLQEKHGWGGWVWAAAIVLGLALGASSFMEFARFMQREADTAPKTDWQPAAKPDAPKRTDETSQKERQT